MDALDLDDLCTVIGYTATRVVAAWFPGRYLHVPTATSPDHPLVALVGAPVLARLVAEFPGERLRIPAASEEGRYRRERVVAEMLASGASPESIAGLVDLTPRRVEQLRVELADRGWLTFLQGGHRFRGRPSGSRLDVPELIVGDGPPATGAA